ncbi:MAG: DUF1579 family protein [Planctomycetota bacterium]
MQKWIMWIAVVAALGLAVDRFVITPHHVDAQASEDMDMAAAMKRWADAGEPGKQHELLAKRVGKWNVESSMWMSQNAPPMKVKGTSEIEAIMDGRYIVERTETTMMGKPWTSMAVTGYSNIRRVFFTTNFDSMSTGYTHAVGGLSRDGKALTFVGEMDEPMTQETGKMFKAMMTFESDDKHKIDIYEILYGEPFRVVSMEFTRQK